MFFRIPLYAYPSLLRYTLRRSLSLGRRPPPPDLSNAELDFFLGGTGAVDRRLAGPAFRFFSAADFGPPPSTAECDSILNHQVFLLGETFDVGDPIQWRRDFRTGYQWPSQPSSRLALVTLKGDVKIPWELSRFQHGLTLALGYTASGDERYLREWVRQFHAWRADNPPEYGPNWGNAMEAAIRAVNWIAAFECVRPALDRVTGETVLKALIQHGRFIASHLEDYWPPTNHLLANVCGLIWLGLFFEPWRDDKHASPEPARWLEFGLFELRKQFRFQILPDGASYEASTAYHRFVTEMVSSTARLCRLNNIFVPPLILDTPAKMEAVIEGLRKPDGTLPLFGDEDGGKWPHPLMPVETPRPAPIARREGKAWTAFPHAGWYIYRGSEDYLAVRAGSNGQAGWGGHAHNDALSFEYAIGARTFFVDPGTYTYTADPETRNLFRSTAYHNTLRADGQEISPIPPQELFRLENDLQVKAKVQDKSWEGEHTGYQRLGLIHKRYFEKRDLGWLIRDTLDGKGEHSLEWFFHFGPECPINIEGLRVWTEFATGPNISLTATLPSLTLTRSSGWVSPTYGIRHPAPVVVYTLQGKLPVRVEFIITKL